MSWRQVLIPIVSLAMLLPLNAWLAPKSVAQTPTDSAPTDFFTTSVAPIFERRCLTCHNASESKGGFSLQTRQSLTDSGMIEAGDPDASHLMELITPRDGHAEMPKDAAPLTSEELDAIRQWISEGAVWSEQVTELNEPQVTDFDWWSYRPLKTTTVPTSDDPWVVNPVDAFVLAKLREHGLSPSPMADRRTLIRRLSYDLIGLPPSPEEVEAFVHDSDPEAYIKLVDRLLNSKHYGERWARHWLDIVKYADTCGYDKDKLRPNAWPYRDYVIRSFNQDKPYGQFVQEQIAGDVLFPDNPDGILGLGFIAAGPWDFIGHVEVPESKIDGKVARSLDRDDMVANVFNTFCSITVQCARCHNHKFDPVSQEQYFGLQAIFAALDRADRLYDLDLDVQEKRETLLAEIESCKQGLAQLANEMKAAGGEKLQALETAIADLEAKVHVVKDDAFGYHSQIASVDNTEKWVQVDLGTAESLAEIRLYPCHDEFAGIGAGFGFPKAYRVEVSLDGDQWQPISEVLINDNNAQGLMPAVVPASNQTARYVRVVATKLAPRSNDFIFALAELEVFNRDGENIANGATVTAFDSIEAPVRWAAKNLVDGKWAHYSDLDSATRLATVKEQRSQLLQALETEERVSLRESLNQRLEQANNAYAALPAGKLVYAAATNFATQGNFKPTQGVPREVFVLRRGDVQTPLQRAVPQTIPLGHSLGIDLEAASDEGAMRAELARWLTHPEHPLVWRSIVNRVWQYHFGEGIVSTPNDFGRMGAEPTHPALLDWLAVHFRDSGQSFKELHRLLVTSNTYQQASVFREDAAKIDGSNQFLWQMPRRRLSAEELRDSILLVSGTLDQRMGGPGFYLFELEKTEHSPHYEYHKFDPSDRATHRRSIYRFIVRSQPDPWMTTLDCADSSQSTPKRIETLTALQALSLLNNRFNLFMAETFAERLQREHTELDSQLTRAMQLIAQRSCTEDELSELKAYAEQHGLANTCRILLNLNEFVFVD